MSLVFDKHSPDRILTTPLLQQENDKCNDETYQIALPEEGFFQSKTLTSFLFLHNGSLYFCHLIHNAFRTDFLSSQVRKILDCFFMSADRSEPTGRFLLEHELYPQAGPNRRPTLTVNSPNSMMPAGTS